MAVTSLWRVKGYIGKVVLYTLNPQKTEKPIIFETGMNNISTENTLTGILDYVERDKATNQQQLVTGIKCTNETAVKDMMAVKNFFKKSDGVIAYHGFQSFAADEVTPDTAHEIGVDLATELWGDKYQVLITTHLDKESHIHNHFVINTVSFRNGKKFHRTKRDYQYMRETSDRLCRERGLSIVENHKNKGKNYAEWRAEKEGKPTVRGGIREDIDTAIKGCMNSREFYDAMKQMGYIIDTSGKHPKIKPPNHERFFRFDGLGNGYSLNAIEYRVYNNTHRIPPKFEPQEPLSNILYKYTDIPGSFTIMGFRPLYQTYVYGLKITKERPSTNKRMHWLLRTEITKLDRYIFQSELLCRHNIDTAEQLSSFKLSLNEQIFEIKEDRRRLKNELKRTERTGDQDVINDVKRKLKDCTDRLKSLRAQVKACDEIFERSGVLREKLTELEKIYRKEKSEHEYISRSGRPNRQDVSQRR